MSDSATPEPPGSPRLWDSPGKNTGVGCHFLLQWMKVKSESEVSQSCPTLSDLMDCSLPASSVHGIFQARGLEWVAIAFSLINLAAAAAAKSLQSCPSMCDPIDGSPPGSPPLGFSREEHWSGLPFPSPSLTLGQTKTHAGLVYKSWLVVSLFQETCSWEFPVVQQLGAGAFTAGAWVQSLVRELRPLKGYDTVNRKRKCSPKNLGLLY